MSRVFWSELFNLSIIFSRENENHYYIFFRLFGLIPVSHEDALVFAHQSSLDITFRMTRPLTDFMATLHKNGTEEKKLSKYVVILTQKKLINDYFFVEVNIILYFLQVCKSSYTRGLCDLNRILSGRRSVWYGHLYERSFWKF